MMLTQQTQTTNAISDASYFNIDVYLDATFYIYDIKCLYYKIFIFGSFEHRNLYSSLFNVILKLFHFKYFLGMLASAILSRFERAHFSSAKEKRGIYDTYLEIA